jgi:hypothetical protein
VAIKQNRIVFFFRIRCRCYEAIFLVFLAVGFSRFTARRSRCRRNAVLSRESMVDAPRQLKEAPRLDELHRSLALLVRMQDRALGLIESTASTLDHET